MYHETLLDFQPGPVLSNKGIIPGIRADADVHFLPILWNLLLRVLTTEALPHLQAAAHVSANGVPRFPATRQLGDWPSHSHSPCSFSPCRSSWCCLSFRPDLHYSFLPAPSKIDVGCHAGGLSDSNAVKYINAVNVVANKASTNSPLSFSSTSSHVLISLRSIAREIRLGGEIL